MRAKIMTNLSNIFNFGSLVCVSISMATMIQILQIIMLCLSIILTVAGVFSKLVEKWKNKTLTSDDINDAKEQIEKLSDNINKIKGDKNE